MDEWESIQTLCDMEGEGIVITLHLWIRELAA
jgi:hypothetical protein